MFRKPKRSNLRQRRQDNESDEDPDLIKHENKPDSLSPDPPILQQAAKLSFASDHDEEGAEFTVKKSGRSLRIAKQLEKERKKREHELNEKNKQAKRLNSSESIRKQMEQKELQVVFVNQQNVMKEKEKVQEIVVPDEDGMSDDDGDDLESEGMTFRPRSHIPDAETIFSLKKQRLSKRNQEDFIALVQDTLPTTERLDDNRQNDDDDDEFEDDRIDFEVDKSESERRKAREAIDSAQEQVIIKSFSKKSHKSSYDSSDSSDNELSKWEEEQIMKGVGASNTSRIKAKIDDHTRDMDVSSPQGMNQVSLFDKRSSVSSIPSHLSQTSEKVSIDDVLNRLHEAITEKKDKLAYLERQVNNISIEEKSLTSDLEKLESLEKDLDAKRTQLFEKLQQKLKEKQDL